MMVRNPLYRAPDASLFNNHDIANGREGKFIRIPKEDLRDLVLKAQQGDMKAKDAVCREVYRFVLKRVSSFKRKGVERVEPDDLFQAGMNGVLTAIEKFEYDRGFSFLTYLTAWVDQAIDREFQNTFCEVRIPNHVWGSYRQLTTAYREIVGERAEGDEDYEVTVPKDVLISKALENAKDEERTQISEGTLESAYTYLLRGGANIFMSLDQPHGSDDEDGENSKFLSNVLEDQNYSTEQIEDNIHMDDTARNVRFYTRYLDRRTRYVLMRRFGMGNNHSELTLEEVGNELGVTRERIRQIEANGIRILKRLMTTCRTLDPSILEMNMKSVYGRRPPKPFTVPSFVVLTEEEQEIMKHDLFGEIKETYKSGVGRRPFEGNRYKGRIVPDWFDASQVRSTGVRKRLKDDELNAHEILIRYSMYGKRELTQEEILANV